MLRAAISDVAPQDKFGAGTSTEGGISATWTSVNDNFIFYSTHFLVSRDACGLGLLGDFSIRNPSIYRGFDEALHESSDQSFEKTA